MTQYNFVTLLNILSIVKVVFGMDCSEGKVYYSYSNSCIECGLTNYTKPNVKIVGGVPANPHSWPAQALIIQRYKGYYEINGNTVPLSVRLQCGGTVINSYSILTAAHCISTKFKSNGRTYNMNFANNPFYTSLESTFTIYLGLHNASFLNYAEQTPSQPAVIYNVSKIIVYPYYNSQYSINDISLLILSNEIYFNKFIQPACFQAYSVTYPTPNRTSYAAGWGTNSQGGVTPDELYNVNLTIYDMSLCENISPSIPKNVNSQICAGDYNGGKDTCQGDSGGGLYILDTLGGTQRYIVSGITSYGDGCGNAASPGIYTRVSYFSDWIKSNFVVNSTRTTTKAITSTTIDTAKITTTTNGETMKKSSTSGLSNDAIIAIGVIVPSILICIILSIIVCIICKEKKNKKKNKRVGDMTYKHQEYQPYQIHQHSYLTQPSINKFQISDINKSINPHNDIKLDQTLSFIQYAASLPTYQPKITVETTNYREIRAERVFDYNNEASSDFQQLESNDAANSHFKDNNILAEIISKKIDNQQNTKTRGRPKRIHENQIDASESNQNIQNDEKSQQNHFLDDVNIDNNEEVPSVRRPHKKKLRYKNQYEGENTDKTKYAKNDEQIHDDIIKSIEQAIQQRKPNGTSGK